MAELATVTASDTELAIVVVATTSLALVSAKSDLSIEVMALL